MSQETFLDLVEEVKPVADDSPYSVGKIIRLGNYWMDDAGYKQPIPWRILKNENGKLFLLSVYVLDEQKYVNDSFYGQPWCSCDLRKWLNKTFFREAFSDDEKQALCCLAGGANSECGKPYNKKDKNDRDKVFLLSSEDAMQYFESDFARRCVPTAYAISRGVPVYPATYNLFGMPTCDWYLRTYKNEGKYTYPKMINADGKELTALMSQYGIRPAVWLDIPAFEKVEAKQFEAQNTEKLRQQEKENQQLEASMLAEEKWIKKHGLLPTISPDVKKWDIVRFGRYKNAKGLFGPVVKDLEWLVLTKKEDRVLLISRYAIDCLPYMEMKRFNQNLLGIDWERCTLRKWLNNVFLNSAFFNSEKEKILWLKIPKIGADKNEPLTEDDIIRDKVFLLTRKDAENLFPSREKRACVPTLYAASRIIPLGSSPRYYAKRNCIWWLRLTKNTLDAADYIDKSGDPGIITLHNIISVTRTDVFVRPAIWVKLDAGKKAKEER